MAELGFWGYRREKEKNMSILDAVYPIVMTEEVF